MAANWFDDEALQKIIVVSFKYLKYQFWWHTDMKSKLERLQENLPKIDAVVFATQEIRDQIPELNKWLWKLRDVIDEADDLLDEFEYMKYKLQVAENNGETKVLCGIMIFLFETVRKFGECAHKNNPNLKKLDVVVQKLYEVSDEVNTFLHLVHNTTQEQQRRQLHENREEGSWPINDLIGREKDKEFVMMWLRQSSNEDPTHIASTALYKNISILFIVGHGGMGKTTLLCHVYVDEITEEFDLKMWVCVTNNFDVKKVIRDMLECLQKRKFELESLDALQRRLKSAVSSNKFLLVLDDIWEEDEEKDIRKWEKVLAPLAYGKLGSKILVTTRMGSVASMFTEVMKKNNETLILKGLMEDECLQLLSTHAFGGVENLEDHRKLRPITRMIAKKLSGSPLAAKVIGSALNSCLDERHWIEILNSEFGQNDIFPILRLSFEFLPRHLRKCFAFCCIFPQDHEFDKDDLVRMWIALGFIQSSTNHEETLEDIGGRYFDILVKKSFFDVFQSYSGTRYKMNNLIYGLAQSVSAHECFRVARDKKLKGEISETIRHLSVKTENPEISETIRHLSVKTENPEILKQIEKFRRLRSLFLSTNVENKEIVDALNNIFQSSRSIRLLCISSQNLRLIPDAIENLVHLRYIKIYGNETTPLPRSLSNLYQLQFITCDLHLNEFLPRDMKNLFNLRYLNLPMNCFDKIHETGKLRLLQELNEFSVKNEIGYRIQELEHMNQLRRLRIKMLENVTDTQQACNAKLCDKKNLTDLSLEWGVVDINKKQAKEYSVREVLQNIVEGGLYERVLDNLRPHNSLEKLRIHSYMGVSSPNWLRDDYMSNLQYIELDKCLTWQTLPPFGNLPFLKSLYLCNMPEAKSIYFKHHRDKNDSVFPSLELLRIEKLNVLEDWFDARITTNDCFFPCLTELYLRDCPNLKELPRLPPKLKSLEMFNIGWKTLSSRNISNSISRESLSAWNSPNITCISLADKITKFAALGFLEIPHLPHQISLAGHQEVETTENRMVTLNTLRLNNPSMLLLEPLRSITSLQELRISENNLDPFPNEVGDWFLRVRSSVLEMWFMNLKSLRSLPSFVRSLSSLKKLHIEDVPQLQDLPDFPASLEYLHLSRLESLQFLPSLSAISSLKRLWIENVPLLQQLPDLPSSLEDLFITGCHEELRNHYADESGSDWYKLAHIPLVRISKSQDQ